MAEDGKESVFGFRSGVVIGVKTMNDDASLLRQYAVEKSEAAFAEFVRRHLGLVYSSALRRLRGDSHLAADVAQVVFIKVAREAEKLSRHPAPASWLFATTRNAAVDLARSEHRRRIREQEAAFVREIMAAEDPQVEWERITPVLDAAVDALSEPDRTAVLLRIFEGRPFAEVGAALDLREDAARMRVDRALEKLRMELSRRGVVFAGGSLSVLLAGQATAMAPVGLAASVTATAISTGQVLGTTAVFLSTMSSIKTSLVVGAVVLGAIGFAVHQSRQLADGEKELTELRRGIESPSALNSNAGIGDVAARLEEVVKSSPSPPVERNPPDPGDIQARVEALKEILARLPEQDIPELRLATDSDWYAAVDGKLETTEDYRRALGKLRAAAERRFAELVQPALREFLRVHPGQFPSDTSQLQPLVGGEINLAMLQRYKVAPASEVPNVQMGGSLIITQVGLVDSTYDTTSVIGPNGFGATSVAPEFWRELALIRPAMKAYQAATGEKHTDILQVMPYATTPAQQAVIRKWAENTENPRR